MAVIEDTLIFDVVLATNRLLTAPLSIALTEFHILLLYADKIQAICRLNQQVEYEERIPFEKVVIMSCSVLFCPVLSH